MEVVVILICLVLWFVAGSIFEKGCMQGETPMFPSTIGEECNISVSGCWVIFILVSIIFPINFLFKVVIRLCQQS